MSLLGVLEPPGPTVGCVVLPHQCLVTEFGRLVTVPSAAHDRAKAYVPFASGYSVDRGCLHTRSLLFVYVCSVLVSRKT